MKPRLKQPDPLEEFLDSSRAAARMREAAAVLNDPKIVRSLEKFKELLEAHSPNWRSQLSPIKKFFCGNRYPINPDALPNSSQDD